MKKELVILGCGSSTGVPAIGNWWGACDPNEPKNRRTRPSIAVLSGETCVVVDTGPDFREQMNREKLPMPDAVIYTHMHSDHTGGMDELRTVQRVHKKNMPVYADSVTMDDLNKRFGHMFQTTENGFYRQVCEPEIIEFGELLSIKNVIAKTFGQDHGTLTSLGLRFGNIGYSTDFKTLNENAIKTLQGIDVWIADSAGFQSPENPVHACIDEVIELNKKIGAQSVYLTHMPPTMDYHMLTKMLPDGFAPAYDGLRLEIMA